MNVTVVEKGEILLVGFSFFGDPFSASAGWTEENEIGRLWQRFMKFLTAHGEHIKHVVGDRVSYELHLMHEETQATGHYEVFVGIEVSELDDLPVELLVKALPATAYAVATLVGEEITADWEQEVYRAWIPAAGFEAAGPYVLQRYDERFKGVEDIEDSVIEAYIPIRRVQNGLSGERAGG